MDNKGLLTLGAVGLVLYLVWKSNQNADAAPAGSPSSSGNLGNDAPDTGPAGTALDLSSLQDDYGVANVSALQNLENVLANTGQLSVLQQQMMLSQALLETGLFTGNPNWSAVTNKNNFGGIMSGGGIETFPDIAAFVAAWIPILSKGASPITADNIADFNNRLTANGYYGSDSPTQYGANLAAYFDIISQITIDGMQSF